MLDWFIWLEFRDLVNGIMIWSFKQHQRGVVTKGKISDDVEGRVHPETPLG